MGITSVDNSVDNVDNFFVVEKLSTVKMDFPVKSRLFPAFFVDNSVDNVEKAFLNEKKYFYPAYAAYTLQTFGMSGIFAE